MFNNLAMCCSEGKSDKTSQLFSMFHNWPSKSGSLLILDYCRCGTYLVLNYDSLHGIWLLKQRFHGAEAF